MKRIKARLNRLLSSEAAKGFAFGFLEGFRYTITN